MPRKILLGPHYSLQNLLQNHLRIVLLSSIKRIIYFLSFIVYTQRIDYTVNVITNKRNCSLKIINRTLNTPKKIKTLLKYLNPKQAINVVRPDWKFWPEPDYMVYNKEW